MLTGSRCGRLSFIDHYFSSLFQFPVPAEFDHNTMLSKVRDFPYVIPKTLSSALTLLLNEVCKCCSLTLNLYAMVFVICHSFLLEFVGAAFVQESGQQAS